MANTKTMLGAFAGRELALLLAQLASSRASSSDSWRASRKYRASPAQAARRRRRHLQDTQWPPCDRVRWTE